MTYVITQNCCNDADCVSVCPVNCIHPTPEEPGYATAEMLYIDPDGCIDCGACLDACPVNAIVPDFELPEPDLRYEQINALYYADPQHADYDQTPYQSSPRSWDGTSVGPLRVAVVGSGPAACYAAEDLLSQRGLDVQVDMFERLPVPGGLVRYGVAPDHQQTKGIGETFAATLRRKGLRLFTNVEVGRDLSHAQLAERYHAVIYSVGAMGDRGLGIPGEDLAGSHSATEFVAWYNGHPDFADRTFDLSHERAVIVGNGNVALDVARILVSDVEVLRRTDMADHALEQLRHSKVQEVVIVGRRGPAEAAFTTPELLGLANRSGVDIVVPADVPDAPYLSSTDAPSSLPAVKASLLAELAGRQPNHDRRVTFRFLRAPVEILGTERVEAVRLVRNELVRDGNDAVARPTGETEDLACGLVFRSVGFQGDAIAGLPFDERRRVLPTDMGRVIDPSTGRPMLGVYATGWIKRGPSGVIGTNKWCARETVSSLLDDHAGGVLRPPARSQEDIAELVPHSVDLQGWRAIDAFERAAGRDQSRPRVKMTDINQMLTVARTGS